MFWTILAVLLAVWLVGVIIGLGGLLIHAILVVVLVVLIVKLVDGTRSR